MGNGGSERARGREGVKEEREGGEGARRGSERVGGERGGRRMGGRGREGGLGCEI